MLGGKPMRLERHGRIPPMKSKLHGVSIVLWSIFWALSLIAVAFFFKGKSAWYGLEATPNVVGLAGFLVLKPKRIDCNR
jgi:hypothetical protein